MPEFHAEPYIYLPAVSHKSALIAWGAFYFRTNSRGKWKIVDDDDLKYVHPPRKDSIGAQSAPYGPARVEIYDASGKTVGCAKTEVANHCWVAGLEPDTEYTYKVFVKGQEWASGERWDWSPKDKALVQSGGVYDNRFCTNPDPTAPARSLSFAVIGDFGVGIRRDTPTRRQQEVAYAMRRMVDDAHVRLLLTTGDNIYARRRVLGVAIGGTGDEDDDWFFTYFQPYRYVINRIPVYPAIGNHDGNETEVNDDRDQIMDNFYLAERLLGEEAAGRASIGPGLFYRFRFGSEIELVCLDSSRRFLLFGERFFRHPNHAPFLEAAFPAQAGGSPRWRIPYAHHPPYCAGPMYANSRSSIEDLVPLYRRASVRLVLSGHEHNFQHSRVDGIDYFVTGGGGKVRSGSPGDFEKAFTVGWAAAVHFLLVKISGRRATVTPIGEDGRPLAVRSPDGSPAPATTTIEL